MTGCGFHHDVNTSEKQMHFVEQLDEDVLQNIFYLFPFLFLNFVNIK